MNNNENGFDINSIINGTPSNNSGNATPNINNSGVGQQNPSQVPLNNGVGVNFANGINSATNDAINNMASVNDPNAIVNEKLKKVDIDYKPPGKYQMFLLIIFFIFIICFALFLPEISSFINLYKAGKLNTVNEEITSGKMTCTLKSNTANLDMNYVRIFYFDNKQLREAEFSLTTRGDSTQDESELNTINKKCENLKVEAENVNGLTVSCEYNSTSITEVQKYKYGSIDTDKLSSAFAEIGGTVPEFSNGEDIDKIEHNMINAGYSCFKEK